MTSPKSGSDRSSIVGMARKYFEPLGGRVIEDRQYVGLRDGGLPGCERPLRLLPQERVGPVE